MDLAHTVGAFGATLFILAFLGGGLFLLYKVVKNEKTTLSITSDGLSYGSNFYRWEDITEIGIMQEYWHRKDLYCTTRFHPGRLDLVLSKGLSPEQIETVFRALRSEVIATYPHVQLVDTSHGQADV